MELMNKELLKLTKELDSASVFKQDPRLTAAIDKLYRNNVQAKYIKASGLVLPERKLDFGELQNLLKDSSNKGNFNEPFYLGDEKCKANIIIKCIYVYFQI